MNYPLFQRIPAKNETTDSLILDRFLDFVKESQLSLYPAQEEAILELIAGKNIILNTPTGSGKSLVATAVHFNALALRRSSIYTCPIKALVNEKFLALCRDFGPDQVGMITGDASVNSEAPILCCTAEILSNMALRLGDSANLGDVVMDEFHYYSDRERGAAWQIPLLTLPQTRFLLMSATLGDTDFFQKTLTQLNGKPTEVIRSADRPVPLLFEYLETPLHETVAKLITHGRAPIYLVSFTQRQCAEEAQNFLSVDFCTKEEKKLIQAALEGFRFSSPWGKDMQKLLKHGVGIHHAGLLPKYRVLVERLAQKGLLKIICGTDTLGVGVNVPIRTVLFTKLCKFDGEKTGILSIRDFQQISGRAGRKGFDHEGFVVAQAPEHVIENLRLEQKAAGDSKKLRKIVKRKPPEKGYVPWTRETFQKLVEGQPEPLSSRFKVTHAMLLNVLSRGKNGCKEMQKLIRNSHESPNSKRHHGKMAFQLFRSLVDRKIIEFNPLRVNIDLQEDFSLNHALSLYLLDTIHLLDLSSPDYALDLLTLVESILENPDLVLRKQLDRMKTEKMDEMKLAGIEYEERIEELEKLEYPKPNRDFIYDTFNDFSAAHPWVGSDNIRPKSIAREMYETFQSFSEYVRDYDLQRIEGTLLRYLSDVYKTLAQTVPDQAKTEEVHALSVYLGTLVRQIDSSLLDEWEKMKNPDWIRPEEKIEASHSSAAPDITRDKKAFTILIRNEVFRLLKALATQDYETALTLVESSRPDTETPWTADELTSRMTEYYTSDHSKICTDPQARNPKHTLIQPTEDQKAWKIQQIFVDPEENNDWSMDLLVDLEQSRQNSQPVLQLVRIGAIG